MFTLVQNIIIMFSAIEMAQKEHSYTFEVKGIWLQLCVCMCVYMHVCVCTCVYLNVGKIQKVVKS